MEYLGVIVGKGQVKMDPVKVQAIANWPEPTNFTELCSFLGFGNYYRNFIPNYSCIMQPLHDTMKKHNGPKNPPFDQLYWWSPPPQQAAFNLFKQLFISYPVLQHPDPAKWYILDTDASQFAMGAVLSQKYPNRRHSIAYFSKSLSPAEQITTFMIGNYMYLPSSMP